MSRYRRLKIATGKTPLVELNNIKLPNRNRVFAKLEYRNPGGSHYDRVYVRLFQRLESEGIIKPGITRLVETTSGNGGASFAWIASQLGYDCTVIIPADVAKTRKRQILDRGAHLLLSPAGEYIQGAVKLLQQYLADHKEEYKSGKFYFLNHSQDPLSVKAVAPIADEINDFMMGLNLAPDYLILACGNGTTIIGVGQRLKAISPNTQCLIFDPFEAPVAFERKFPGRYEREFGIEPAFQRHRHRIWGTGVWGVRFPHIENPLFLSVVDDVYLVRDEEMTQAQDLLAERERLYPGRSSAASIAVALRLAHSVSNKNIIVIFYDELNYYPEPG